jgi:RHS repeat-associated protein
VWRWNSRPFGDSVPNEDPDGDLETYTLNMRFPGQYFDAESALNYNYFRDYDPAIGRYVESDPIGLDGGLNTYGYVRQNPLGFTDSSGLQVAVIPNPIAIGIGIGVTMCAANEACSSAVGKAVDAIVEACADEEDDRCEKAKRQAQRQYDELRFRTIPQYMQSSRHGIANSGHYDALLQGQAALKNLIGKVKANCKVLPPELPDWERLANQNFVPRH